MATKTEEYEIQLWKIVATKSHILPSQCSHEIECTKSTHTNDRMCDFCNYSTKLLLPHLPEMVFSGNKLIVSHAGNYSIEFNAFDALKTVIIGEMPLQIACADAWKSTRKNNGFTDPVHPFDWTYTTEYHGTLHGDWLTEKTNMSINLEKLKQKEKILFYEDIILYEDELHDNGIAKCSVKIRVMGSGFFILLRFFLRVDGVLVRLNDTRLYHEFNNNYILCEYSTRQSNIDQLQMPQSLLTDTEPTLHDILTLVKSETVKLIFQ